jgi:hypothetical protein
MYSLQYSERLLVFVCYITWQISDLPSEKEIQKPHQEIRVLDLSQMRVLFSKEFKIPPQVLDLSQMRGVFSANRAEIENKIRDLEHCLSRQGTDFERKELADVHQEVDVLEAEVEMKKKKLAELEKHYHVTPGSEVGSEVGSLEEYRFIRKNLIGIKISQEFHRNSMYIISVS